MDRSYVTVHVGADTQERIRERTDAEESVEDWVRDAIHQRLDADGASERSENHDSDDEPPRDDEQDYEFVDDCSV
jgi:hypothetical protein